MYSFSDLLADNADRNSLEQGNPAFVRHSVYSEAGQRALELYETAVTLMKARSEINPGDPLGWIYQAGIHGTFFGQNQVGKEALATWADANGFATYDDVLNRNTVLNNCTHYQSLWNTPGATHKNFISWHRLYLQSFEEVVRAILVHEDLEGAETWALPYWEYTQPGQDVIPEIFRDEESGLYEFSRSVRINAGEALNTIDYSGSTTVLESIQDGLARANAAITFEVFNSAIEQSPHNTMHVVIGGIIDSPPEQIAIGLAQAELALNILEPSTIDYDDPNYIAAVVASTVNQRGLMYNVGAAALDPVFWNHHAYIDKTWSDWNQSENANYLFTSTLRLNPWNYAFFEPANTEDNELSAELTTYSSWGDNPEQVLANVYHPNYIYAPDPFETPSDSNIENTTINAALTLLEHPNFSPTIDTLSTKITLEELAQIQDDESPIPFPLDIKIGDILSLANDNLFLGMTFDYSIPMDASQTINFYVLPDLAGITPNSLPRGVDPLQIVPFPMTPADQGMSQTMLMEMSISFDLTAYVLDTLRASNQLDASDPALLDAGLILVSSDLNSLDNASRATTFTEISLTLNQNLNLAEATGNGTFDAAAYLTEYPELLANPLALADPYQYFLDYGEAEGQIAPTLDQRAMELGFGYLAANPDLVAPLGNNPFLALDQYLDTGLADARQLVPDGSELTDSIIGDLAFRLFNTLTGQHLTSATATELYTLMDLDGEGWSNEGAAFGAGGNRPVFRFYNPSTGGHLYSTSPDEVAALGAPDNPSTFIAEGEAFRIYSEPTDHPLGSSELIRFFNPTSQQHLISGTPSEQDALAQNPNWISEGRLGWVNNLI